MGQPAEGGDRERHDEHRQGCNADLNPWTSLVVQTVKRLPTMWETWVQSLGREDPLEKEMATHSSTLAWKIPWTEEPRRLQSMGSQRARHDWVTSFHFTLLNGFRFLEIWASSSSCWCREEYPLPDASLLINVSFSYKWITSAQLSELLCVCCFLKIMSLK